MILSIWGFSGELHKKLKIAAAMRDVTMLAIVTEAIEGHLSGASTPIVEPVVASVPVVEHTSPVGHPEVTEVRPIHAKKKEAEWAQGMCPKHGRMAINGKFTCC